MLTKCFLAAIQGKGPEYCLIPSSVLSCLTLASHRRLVAEITLSCFPEINLMGTLVLSTHTQWELAEEASQHLTVDVVPS